MKEQVLKALQSSIRKWDRIAAGQTYSDGPDNCPLCKIFYWPKDCEGCPVKEQTGRSCCIGSPYEVWENMGDEHKRIEQDSHEFADSDFAKMVAKAEANYLRALLPRRSQRTSDDAR